MPHGTRNKQISPLKRTKTSDIQPKLNAACFVQSCLADADFVLFSNYCLIGTRQKGAPLFTLRISEAYFPHGDMLLRAVNIGDEGVAFIYIPREGRAADAVPDERDGAVYADAEAAVIGKTAGGVRLPRGVHRVQLLNYGGGDILQLEAAVKLTEEGTGGIAQLLREVCGRGVYVQPHADDDVQPAAHGGGLDKDAAELLAVYQKVVRPFYFGRDAAGARQRTAQRHRHAGRERLHALKRTTGVQQHGEVQPALRRFKAAPQTAAAAGLLCGGENEAVRHAAGGQPL